MADSAPKSRRDRRRKRSRRLNPDGTMTLIEHIYEFRRRLGWALLAVLAGGIFGFIWFNTRMGPVPSLGSIINDPYCAIPADRRLGSTEGCYLLQTVPFEAFMIQLKVGLAGGAVLTSPLWLYQLWAFIAPGLYTKERKYALTFVGFASVLFAGGAVLAYLLIPHALQLLMGFGNDFFITGLTGDKYISFVLSLLIIFGVSFELPLLLVMLNFVGVLKYAQLKRWRRGIIMAVFVFAAFATPGSDPFSMIALAGALTVLAELAIQIARVHDKRKYRGSESEEWAGLDDNEAAPFDYTPSSIDDTPAKPKTEDVT
ncbi:MULTISPECIES: twin-arginine translocase subunit TatC [Amycolatopsis]|uniref:Sec-independent protein translocase protein TatC n=1 Tax=Amycolatopsis thermalba TaxID=944492 RepID=A0ABY4NY49_9PSEU|nr:MULTISPECIES: twin-arginine translocase subunit TatC [Amycolatopsis]OXM74810.1 twin-arginine translocase subunit TatC [Amycolatopsis sp. KNN50.9b]UQS25014.1 twin-arginine translocase subunit TatC [Amycolatopsis thermalba]